MTPDPARSPIVHLKCALCCAGLLVLAACSPGKDRAYWQEYENGLRQFGALRTERDPTGITFTNAQFLRNFREIMFYDEYSVENGAYVSRRTPRRLEKRVKPLTYKLSGGSVREEDRSHLGDIVSRVERTTGLGITPTEDGADISIFIGDHAERMKFADFLEEATPGSPLVTELRNDFGDNVCVAIPFYEESETYYSNAKYLILIPGELGGVLRRACIEEEFGQAFGPAADYAGARPSIFNDDQEFALFTAHDELMFRVIYDRRLRPGMSEDEAMPIVETILREIRPIGPVKLTGGDQIKGPPRVETANLKIDEGDGGKPPQP